MNEFTVRKNAHAGVKRQDEKLWHIVDRARAVVVELDTREEAEVACTKLNRTVDRVLEAFAIQACV